MESSNPTFHRGNFATRLGIVLATAGSSVGLGNIWRFPVETGANGGAAFILIYLLCVIFLGVPMMTAEFIIGRRAHTDIASAYQRLAPRQPWYITGYAGMLCVTLILSYYSVVAGWVLKYAVDAATGTLASVSDTAAYFSDFSTSTWTPLFFALVFLLLTHIIIVRGVQNGIERFSKLLMPLLLIIMLLLAIGSLTMSGAAAGVEFLLKPDFSKIDSSVVLSALGQAFFSLSIAIGCLSTYASYFKPDVPLMKTAANVVGIDTVVAILSGGNMDVITMSSVVQQGLILRDRVFTVSILLPDRPGELERVAGIIARENANVIKLEHNQFVTTNRSEAVELRITMEAFGTEHKKAILEKLEETDYRPKVVRTTL